jgi:hypothetical protein
MLSQDAEVAGVSYDGEKSNGLAFSLSLGTRYARTETFVGWDVDYMDFDSNGGGRSSRFYGPSIGASIGLFTAVPWFTPYFGAGIMALNHELTIPDGAGSVTLAAGRKFAPVVTAGIEFGVFDGFLSVSLEYKNISVSTDFDGLYTSTKNSLSAVSLKARFNY